MGVVATNVDLRRTANEEAKRASANTNQEALNKRAAAELSSMFERKQDSAVEEERCCA